MHSGPALKQKFMPSGTALKQNFMSSGPALTKNFLLIPYHHNSVKKQRLQGVLPESLNWRLILAPLLPQNEREREAELALALLACPILLLEPYFFRSVRVSAPDRIDRPKPIFWYKTGHIFCYGTKFKVSKVPPS
jgi:hypothetical protein